LKLILSVDCNTPATAKNAIFQETIIMGANLLTATLPYDVSRIIAVSNESNALQQDSSNFQNAVNFYAIFS